MGILAELLAVRDAPVTSLNGGTGALTLAGTAPMSFTRVGQVVTGAIVVAGAGRGHLLHHGITNWGSLAPPNNSMSVLMGNGAGANLSWVQLAEGNNIALDRVGNVLTITYEP